MNDSFCPIPWNHLAVFSNGNLRMCCQCIYGTQGKLLDEKGQPLNARDTKIDNLQNHPFLKEVRTSMLKGEKHPQCQLCWMEESNDMHSRRQKANHMFPEMKEKAFKHTQADGTVDTDKIKHSYFDLRLGIRCNLKCRMCGPRDSSFWVHDYAVTQEKFWKRDGQDPHVIYSDEYFALHKKNDRWEYKTDKFKWYENSALIESLHENMNGIERLYFTGGEPMLIQQHWDFLKSCIEKGHAPNIHVEYNTNLTLMRPEHIELLENFKTVGLGVSVDGVDAVAEYIRHPAKWATIKKNLQLLNSCSHRFFSTITPTISIFNVLNILDLSKWLYKQNFIRISPIPSTHILEQPNQQSIQILPASAKEVVQIKYKRFFNWMKRNMAEEHYVDLRQQLEAILNYMNAADKSHLLEDFLYEVDSHDKLREENFRLAIPDVHLLCNVYSLQRFQSLKKAFSFFRTKTTEALSQLSKD